MTPLNIENLERLLAEATPGEWKAELLRSRQTITVTNPHSQNSLDDWLLVVTEGGDREANAALIVAAVNALPQLLAAAREGERCRAALEDHAQRLYEENGANPRQEAALRKLIDMWEDDDWIVKQEEMLTIARQALHPTPREGK